MSWKNLEALGIDLDEAAMRKVTERVVELSDKKEQVTAEDLPYIIADVLRYDPVDTPVRILNYSLSLAQGMHPVATAPDRDSRLRVRADLGGRRPVRRLHACPAANLPRTARARVSDAARLYRFDSARRPHRRLRADDHHLGDGRPRVQDPRLDADQTEAAIKATVKMLNIIEINYNDNGC